MFDFDYLIKKLTDACFASYPFKHIYIEDFFSSEHFEQLLASEEIASPKANSDDELIDGLYAKGYKVIDFPGCVTDRSKYVAWHSEGRNEPFHSACEGFGMVLRLYSIQSPILVAINEFISSERFNRAIAEKFGIDFEQCITDGGIQKYLDGYEISPHPDIRRKAATFMININPSPLSESLNHHTHYLRLTKKREYVKSFWEGNVDIDRAWVPWDWAETVHQQKKNNSIVLFSPSNETFHGVKADYEHLKTQRTQLYGNVWYKEGHTTSKLEWEDMGLLSKKTTSYSSKSTNPIRSMIARTIPSSVKTFIKRAYRKTDVDADKGMDLGERKTR